MKFTASNALFNSYYITYFVSIVNFNVSNIGKRDKRHELHVFWMEAMLR